MPPEKNIALGLYRLGHENSFVVGPSFNGVSCYLRKNLEIERELLAELPVCIVFHVTLTSIDSCRCDSNYLAQLFENLPAPPKLYGVFDVLLIRKVFCQSLGRTRLRPR